MSCVHVLVMHGELDLRVKLSDPLQMQSIMVQSEYTSIRDMQIRVYWQCVQLY
jgi:hypothetical protein